MRLVFTRQADGATFEVGDFSGPYVLSPETQIAPPTELDVSGYEFSGSEGGYSTASRFKRRAFDLIFTVQERRNDPRGLFELIAEARAFFDPHRDDLSVILYDCEVFSCDKANSSFVMRNGAVSVPMASPVERNERIGNGVVSFIFGDPYLYHTSGGGVATATLHPYTPTGDPYGRLWGMDGAVWQGGLKMWEVPVEIPGQPVTVQVLSETTVGVEIEIHGEVTDPVIDNLTNGSQFEYGGVVPAGSTLTVSTNGSVLLDGAVAPGIWSGRLTAQGGSNTFLFSASSSIGSTADLRIAGAF